MYYGFRKRITRIEIPNTTETPEEVLKLAKEKEFEEKLISDSFFIEEKEDGTGTIIAKEKVIYDGSELGKVLRYTSL